MSNKREYRIVEKWDEVLQRKLFYPQYKWWFFWRSLKTHSGQTLENYYKTYEEALSFLEDRIPKVHYHCVCIKEPGMSKVVIHSIKIKNENE
jgi:hypothetical protein